MLLDRGDFIRIHRPGGEDRGGGKEDYQRVRPYPDVSPLGWGDNICFIYLFVLFVTHQETFPKF